MVSERNDSSHVAQYRESDAGQHRRDVAACSYHLNCIANYITFQEVSVLIVQLFFVPKVTNIGPDLLDIICQM